MIGLTPGNFHGEFYGLLLVIYAVNHHYYYYHYDCHCYYYYFLVVILIIVNLTFKHNPNYSKNNAHNSPIFPNPELNHI